LVLLGLATFLSVGIFAGTSTYSRTVNELKVEAAAVLRKSQGPVTGFYIAQTSNRFYLGVGATGEDGTHARLVGIPTENVADFAVTDLASVSTARTQAARLGLRLCKTRDRETEARPGGTVEAAACTHEQEEALRERALSG
jgi:hypothetical protein